MANIAPGLSGTFKASTAEGRALEVLIFMQLAEQVLENNPENLNIIEGSINTETKRLEGIYKIPAAQTINASGELVISAKSFIQGLSITPGENNPTFKSVRPESYLLEVLMYLQFLERMPSNNPSLKNYITGTFNSDTELYQGSFTLPIQYGLAGDGTVAISADPYLQT